MYNHEPANYKCPMCGVIKGNSDQLTKRTDVIYDDKQITAFISPKWRINNPGNVIIIPNKHFENLYVIPDNLLAKIHEFAKKVAIALKKTYQCDGTSIRQHNEPAGNQEMWHFHVHVFPRYKNDRLYQLHDKIQWVGQSERKPYAAKLKTYFNTL